MCVDAGGGASKVASYEGGVHLIQTLKIKSDLCLCVGECDARCSGCGAGMGVYDEVQDTISQTLGGGAS
jgi:hypothetical protein